MSHKSEFKANIPTMIDNELTVTMGKQINIPRIQHDNTETDNNV